MMMTKQSTPSRQVVWHRDSLLGGGSIPKSRIELGVRRLGRGSPGFAGDALRTACAGGLNSAKHSNPRPQGQNLAILVGMRTRVRFRIPPPFPSKNDLSPETVGGLFFRFPPVKTHFTDLAPSRAPSTPIHQKCVFLCVFLSLFSVTLASARETSSI